MHHCAPECTTIVPNTQTQNSLFYPKLVLYSFKDLFFLTQLKKWNTLTSKATCSLHFLVLVQKLSITCTKVGLVTFIHLSPSLMFSTILSHAVQCIIMATYSYLD